MLIHSTNESYNRRVMTRSPIQIILHLFSSSSLSLSLSLSFFFFPLLAMNWWGPGMKEMQYLSTHCKYGWEILREFFFFFFFCFFGICFNAAWIYSEMSWEVSTIKMTKYKHKKIKPLCLGPGWWLSSSSLISIFIGNELHICAWFKGCFLSSLPVLNVCGSSALVSFVPAKWENFPQAYMSLLK